MNTKEKLFDAALVLFSEKGFTATTIRDITRRTGLTPGAFYNHFASKSELLQAVYDHYTRLYIHAEQSDPPDYAHLLAQHGPVGLFETLTRRYTDAMRNEKLVRLTKIILMEQYTNKTAGEIAFHDRQRLLQSMEELFVLMDRQGYIRAENPQKAGRLLGYVYLGFAADNVYEVYWEHKGPDAVAARQMDVVREYLGRVLAP